MTLKKKLIEAKVHQIKIVERFIEIAKEKKSIDLAHIDRLETKLINFLYALDELN